jgi:transcriptional regulator with XRE-family HTH domain
MGNTNTNWASMTDKAIIETIGSFIKHQRLQQNKTQMQLAKEAGLNRWTLSQIENGEAITLLSLIQILRTLDLLYLFDGFSEKEQISPIEYAKLLKNKRQRARNTNDEEAENTES